MFALPLLFIAPAVGPLACSGGPCATPLVVDVLPDPSGDEVAVETNFGLALRTPTGGWRLACEEAWGSVQSQRYLFTASGVVIASYDGVFRTADRGCTWAAARGAASSLAVYDLAPLDATGAALAAVAMPRGAGPASVLRSSDGAASFAAVFTFADGVRASDVLAAPSDPMHLYVGGFIPAPTRTWVAHSDDGGASFATSTPLPAGEGRLLAVARDNPLRVYFSWVAETGKPDELWRSDDGGATAHKVFTLDGAETLVGAALGPEPGTVYVAGRSAPQPAETPEGTFYVLRDDGDTLATRHARAPAFRCLRTRGAQIFVCAGDEIDGQPFGVGVSEDEGASFAPVFSFADLRGALPCLGGACANTIDWLCLLFGYACNGPDRPDGGHPDGAVLDAPRDPASDEGATMGGGGCGCGLGGTPVPAHTAFMALAWLMTACARRRR